MSPHYWGPSEVVVILLIYLKVLLKVDRICAGDLMKGIINVREDRYSSHGDTPFLSYLTVHAWPRYLEFEGTSKVQGSCDDVIFCSRSTQFTHCDPALRYSASDTN